MTPHSGADVARARSGDQAAFGRLVEPRWSRLVRLARSIAGDLDAEDIAQDACLACWRKLSQLADPARFDSWLMRIVFTRAVRRARWQRLRSFISWDPASAGLAASRNRTNAWDPASAGLAPDAECDLLVEQILARLAPRQRAVVHLTVVEGMTDSEIAEALGIRAGSVRAHRRRARQVIESLWPAQARRSNPAEAGSHGDAKRGAVIQPSMTGAIQLQPDCCEGEALQSCARRTAQRP